MLRKMILKLLQLFLLLRGPAWSQSRSGHSRPLVPNSVVRPETKAKCRGNVWEHSRKEHVHSCCQDDWAWYGIRSENIVARAGVRTQWSHSTVNW